MKFKLDIEIGNDAMRTVDDVNNALLRVAHEVWDLRGYSPEADEERMSTGVLDGFIRDENGNTVGQYGFFEEE